MILLCVLQGNIQELDVLFQLPDLLVHQGAIGGTRPDGKVRRFGGVGRRLFRSRLGLLLLQLRNLLVELHAFHLPVGLLLHHGLHVLRAELVVLRRERVVLLLQPGHPLRNLDLFRQPLGFEILAFLDPDDFLGLALLDLLGQHLELLLEIGHCLHEVGDLVVGGLQRGLLELIPPGHRGHFLHQALFLVLQRRDLLRELFDLLGHFPVHHGVRFAFLQG
mmetsp:Transcript_19046/g.44197  ORF Transcript_19046/g.44197 Transcript_19046/m.44197 type:complete len:220 (+) Transcript_19046:1823-2482(+)